MKIKEFESVSDLVFNKYFKKLQKLEKYVKSHFIYHLIDVNLITEFSIERIIKIEVSKRCREITNWIIVKEQLRKFISTRKQINH